MGIILDLLLLKPDNFTVDSSNNGGAKRTPLIDKINPEGNTSID